MRRGTEKSTILINAVTNGVSFTATLAVGLVVTPILVHGLGDERYGIWLLVSSILAYMALGDLGIGAAVLRYVAKFDGVRDYESINRIFSTSMLLFGVVGVCLLAVTFVMAFGWSQPLGVAPGLAHDARCLLTFLGVNLAFGFPLGLYLTALQGLGHYPLVNAIRIVGLLTRNALFVAIIWLGGGLVEIGAAITVCSLAQNAAYVLAARHCLPTLRFRLRYVDFATLRTIWGYSAYVFVARAAGNVAQQSNPIVINAFLAPTAIAYFGIAATLNTQAGDALRYMMLVLTPAVSKWEAVGDYDTIRRMLLKGTRFVVLLAMPIQVGLMVLGHPFLSIWMGERYADLSYHTLVILAIPLPLTLSLSMANRILHGIGKVGILAILTVTQAALTVLLAIILVRWLGIEGVAWATAIPLTLQCIAVLVLVCRATGTSVAVFFVHAYAIPLLLAVILVPTWLLVKHWLPPVHWSGLASVIAIGLLVYGAMALVVDRELRALAAVVLESIDRAVVWGQHQDRDAAAVSYSESSERAIVETERV